MCSTNRQIRVDAPHSHHSQEDASRIIKKNRMNRLENGKDKYFTVSTYYVVDVSACPNNLVRFFPSSSPISKTCA
eukprot:gene9992-6974_t